MSLHVFANVLTPYGTAANNRGETEGNITTLQKIVWQGQPHSTVSAEAIRFGLRRQFAQSGNGNLNRVWNEDGRLNEWSDDKFADWGAGGAKYIDDDLLGFMSAEAAKSEGESGTVAARRAVLEVTRAISLTPWPGDVTFNAASPGATPSAARKGASNPVPYGTEVHATRYQFGLAMTPERLRDRSRAVTALQALINLRTVAGNHGRFLYDFAPDAVVYRITDDPAPRLLYCFEAADGGGHTVHAPALLNRIAAGDVKPEELLLGVSDFQSPLADSFRAVQVPVFGVKAATGEACKRIESQLQRSGG